MAVLKYWDGSQWVVLAGSGGPDEVTIGAVPPSTPTDLWLDTASIGPTPPSGQYSFRNKIINGDFSVNQRGFTTLTSTASWIAWYGFDQWKGTKEGLGTITYTTQNAALGELPESARTYARIATSGQSGANDYTMLYQSIESVRTLSGKTVTVSFWARAASGTPTVAVELAQFFGTGGGSTEVDSFLGKVTLSTVWTRYSLTVLLPSIVGKTIGTGNNDRLNLVLWTSAGSTYAARTGSMGPQNATIDFWGVQLEEGSVATPYEQKSYGQELLACQRYYVIFWNSVMPDEVYIGNFETVSASATYYFYGLLLPTRMRVRPVVYINAASGFVNAIGTFPLRNGQVAYNWSTPDILSWAGIKDTGTFAAAYKGAIGLLTGTSYIEASAEY